MTTTQYKIVLLEASKISLLEAQNRALRLRLNIMMDENARLKEQLLLPPKSLKRQYASVMPPHDDALPTPEEQDAIYTLLEMPSAKVGGIIAFS